jgi:hypothetical protein
MHSVEITVLLEVLAKMALLKRQVFSSRVKRSTVALMGLLKYCGASLLEVSPRHPDRAPRSRLAGAFEKHQRASTPSPRAFHWRISIV